MIILTTCLVAFLLILFIVSSITSIRSINNEELEEEEKHLLDNIETLTIELTRLRESHQNNLVNKTVNMPNMINNVLDIFETSNIQVPKDIIEEITQVPLYNEKEVFDYIQNQRNYWKLENTKKPYKAVK